MSIEKNEITIVLADDHEIVRAGIRRLLSFDKSLKIIDEANNGADAVELVRYHLPDIALLDILMPRMNGIEAAQEIKSTIPEVAVVILTAYEDYLHIEQALDVGANGYLSKDISAKDLAESMHIVMNGERVFSKSIIKLIRKKHSESSLDPTPVVITKREQEILDLVAAGKTSPEIADILFLSARTIESHRYNLMQKLNMKNTAGLVRYAILHRNISGSEV